MKDNNVHVKKHFIVAGILIAAGIVLEICIAFLAQLLPSK